MKWTLHLILCLWICSSVSQFRVYGNLNRICMLLFCENCINLNYVELVHGAFQVYYILLLFYIFILLIFESLILKLQLKILLYLLKKITVIYSGTINNLFCIFQVSCVFSYFHNFKNKKETGGKKKAQRKIKWVPYHGRTGKVPSNSATPFLSTFHRELL